MGQITSKFKISLVDTESIANFEVGDNLDLRTEEEDTDNWYATEKEEKVQKIENHKKQEEIVQKVEEEETEEKIIPLHDPSQAAGERALLTDSGRKPKVLFEDMEERLKKKKRKEYKREKQNTTSSLYIKDMIGNPDMEEVLHCLSKALHVHMDNAEKLGDSLKLYEAFDEAKHPLIDKAVDLTIVPDADMIYKFITFIFKVQGLSPEVAILCIAYVERLIAISGVNVHRTNWRRLTLGALVIGAKVWDEENRWNVDWSQMFPNMNVTELNRLERSWLELIQYNVTVKSSQYTKYYFELRALSTLDEKHFPLEPLDTESEGKLEERSIAREKKVLKRFKKAQSMEDLGKKHHNRVVLQ